jgi:Na+-transporting methylmalonyl-CoA/oxaloacetate decarboxylase gamma subunit
VSWLFWLSLLGVFVFVFVFVFVVWFVFMGTLNSQIPKNKCSDTDLFIEIMNKLSKEG